MILNLFLALFYIATFISGINRQTVFLSIVAGLIAAIVGIIELVKNNTSLKIPKYFSLVMMFEVIILIYPLFLTEKVNPFYYGLTIGIGILYWLIFFNLDRPNKFLKPIFISITVIYPAIYILSTVFKFNLMGLAGVVFAQESTTIHYYFGMFCAISIVTVIKNGFKNLTPGRLLIVAICIAFLILSNNRTADLSLMLALIYLFTKSRWVLGTKKNLFLLVGGIALVFILASLNKTTIFERPYFAQSIQSFPSHLWGVGMGNFNLINQYLLQTSSGTLEISNFTHNIFLETLSGVGVFSLVFLYFLIRLTIDIFRSKTKTATWGAIVLIFLTNFMFDSSYTMPGIIWLFFAAIGTFQKLTEKDSGYRSLN